MRAYYFIALMNIDRIRLLTQFLEEEPDNPFNVYALAMEYQSDRPEQAKPYFDQLLTKYPDYLPTYYHAAALYARLAIPEKARELYQKGIELAQLQRNQKTLQELQRAKQAFEEDLEEW